MCRIFTADFSELQEIISSVKEKLNALNLDEETVNTAHIICDEFTTNIIKHAYRDELTETRPIEGSLYKKPLKISCSKNGNHLSVEIIDWGYPFDPLEYDSEMDDGGSHGGFGIHIAKKLAHQIKYRREKDRNILTFIVTAPGGNPET